MANRRPEIVDGGAQGHRARVEVCGEIRPRRGLGSQPLHGLGRKRVRMGEPVQDVRRVAQMVLMGREAATRFRIGEIEREVARNERQNAGSRRGQVGLTNHQSRLYKLQGLR